MSRKTAVVICPPGRGGTYNKPELGYLSRHFPDAALLTRFDDMRQAAGQDTLSALDSAARYSVAKHTRGGDNASGLIYAATLGGDFRALGDDIEVVAVTGNSMGWYSALACGGALSAADGFTVVNTMGTLMQESLIGGQLIYPPFVDDNWTPPNPPARKAELLELIETLNTGGAATLTLSIDLGGMLVLAGNEAGGWPRSRPPCPWCRSVSPPCGWPITPRSIPVCRPPRWPPPGAPVWARICSPSPTCQWWTARAYLVARRL